MNKKATGAKTMVMICVGIVLFIFNSVFGQYLALIPQNGLTYDHAYNVSKAAFLTNTNLNRNNFYIYSGSMETDSIIAKCRELNIRYVLYNSPQWQLESIEEKIKRSGLLWFCPYSNSNYQIRAYTDTLTAYRICVAKADSNDKVTGWGNTLEFYDSYYNIGAVNNTSSFVVGVIFGKFISHRDWLAKHDINATDDQIRESMRHSAGQPWTMQTGFGRPTLIPTELCTPVEWSYFNGNNQDNLVTLNWETKTESNNYGFCIYQNYNYGEWKKIKFIPGNGTSSLTHQYSCEDNLNSFGIYQYKLKQIDTDGTSCYHPEIVTIKYYGTPPGLISLKKNSANPPEKFKLYKNYPNPFNPSTNISFDLPTDEYVELKVYNMQGQIVDTVCTGQFSAGYYTKLWTPKKSSGVYLILLTAGDFQDNIIVTLLK